MTAVPIETPFAEPEGRLARPESFGVDGAYTPVAASSPHVVAYLRGPDVAVVATRLPETLARTGWGDATLELPEGRWRYLLTGRDVAV